MVFFDFFSFFAAHVDDDDDPSKAFVVVRGNDRSGADQTPMIKSANKTASARLVKAALVLHKGNVQKAAEWVSKKKYNKKKIFFYVLAFFFSDLFLSPVSSTFRFGVFFFFFVDAPAGAGALAAWSFN